MGRAFLIFLCDYLPISYLLSTIYGTSHPLLAVGGALSVIVYPYSVSCLGFCGLFVHYKRVVGYCVLEVRSASRGGAMCAFSGCASLL